MRVDRPFMSCDHGSVPRTPGQGRSSLAEMRRQRKKPLSYPFVEIAVCIPSASDSWSSLESRDPDANVTLSTHERREHVTHLGSTALEGYPSFHRDHI